MANDKKSDNGDGKTGVSGLGGNRQEAKPAGLTDGEKPFNFQTLTNSDLMRKYEIQVAAFSSSLVSTLAAVGTFFFVN